MKIPFLGIVSPTASAPLKYASSKSSPKQATSPVDAISTCSSGSAQVNRAKENWGTFTIIERGGVKFAGFALLKNASTESSIRSIPLALLKKGKVRDDLRFISITEI